MPILEAFALLAETGGAEALGAEALGADAMGAGLADYAGMGLGSAGLGGLGVHCAPHTIRHSIPANIIKSGCTAPMMKISSIVVRFILAPLIAAARQSSANRS